LLSVPPEAIFEISAKTGINVDKLLAAIIEKVPAPKSNMAKPLRALVFDSKYDPYLGVIAFVRIFDGCVLPGEKLYLIQNNVEGFVKEAGYFHPQLKNQAGSNAARLAILPPASKIREKCGWARPSRWRRPAVKRQNRYGYAPAGIP